MTAPTAPQRVFVTGATGVVGVHAVPLLIARGHEVTAIGALGVEAQAARIARRARDRARHLRRECRARVARGH